ncbi:hypothetical protein GQ600_21114 [Phytophthora cactorum]|nr:hypothetical protein GQ600_21114 [Phytophthora cactorum]
MFCVFVAFVRLGRANLSKPQDVTLYSLYAGRRLLCSPNACILFVLGAADSNPDNLGKPVTIDQFATLENSPIEFLLEGDVAEQSYAADTFSLGLCLLHLFTGGKRGCVAPILVMARFCNFCCFTRSAPYEKSCKTCTAPQNY